MPTADESRRALVRVADAAVATALRFMADLDGSPVQRRDGLLEGVPDIIGYYSLGSSALAADFYEDHREAVAAAGRYVAEPVVPDRIVKIRRALGWVSEAFEDDTLDPASRLAEVVQLETAKPYRETILENTRRDTEAAGWKRVARGDGCKFCQMLSARGTVYRKDTARFAAHANCNCTAQPYFRGEPQAPEATVAQYVASQARRTPEQQARLRDYLNATFPDAPG